MGMSVWGLVAAPLMIAGSPADVAPDGAQSVAFSEDDLFAGDAILTPEDMADAAGGMQVAFELDDVGINTANNDGTVRDVQVNDTITGKIVDNAVTNNSGITTVFNNTGNGVVLQSNVQINIFLDGEL